MNVRGLEVKQPSGSLAMFATFNKNEALLFPVIGSIIGHKFDQKSSIK
jgi:hypothetical protein